MEIFEKAVDIIVIIVVVEVEVLLYVHRNRRFIRYGSRGRLLRLSHSPRALLLVAK